MSGPPVDFFVLCHPRSGSNLLLWALTDHDDVQMSGEIFNKTLDEVGAGLPPGVQPYRPGMDGREFLTRGIFPEIGDRPQPRGFKLFYEHARSDAAAGAAWRYLIAARRIHVIHLIRRNLFDALVSLETARRSGEWFRSIDPADWPPGSSLSPAPVAPFRLPPRTCRDYFTRITAWRKWAAVAFGCHPMLTIDYDADLCADFAATMARVFHFIGAAPMAATPLLARQARIAPAQQITNYDELQAIFRDTPFAGFFNPDSRAG